MGPVEDKLKDLKNPPKESLQVFILHVNDIDAA